MSRSRRRLYPIRGEVRERDRRMLIRGRKVTEKPLSRGEKNANDVAEKLLGGGEKAKKRRRPQ